MADNEEKPKVLDDPDKAYAEIGEYKGNAVITLHGGFRPFTFGLKKAELVLECIDEIKKFVDEENAKKAEKAEG